MRMRTTTPRADDGREREGANDDWWAMADVDDHHRRRGLRTPHREGTTTTVGGRPVAAPSSALSPSSSVKQHQNPRTDAEVFEI